MITPPHLYCALVAVLLLAAGTDHLLSPERAERWLSSVSTVRGIGIFLVILAVPCLFWPGRYFRVLFVALVVSGLWRAVFPAHSIRAQQWSYPRRVHGVLMLAGALLLWVLEP